MAIFKETISVEALGRLLPISQLDKIALRKLAQITFIEPLPPGKTLFLGGQSTRWKWYLLEGRVNLKSKNGGVKQISGTEPEALRPLDTLLRDIDSASSSSQIRYIKIDTERLKKLLIETRERGSTPVAVQAKSEAPSADTKKKSIDFLPDPEPEEQEETADDLIKTIREQIEDGSIQLPVIPGDALQIASAISKPNLSAKAVATMLGQNPEISKLVLRICNNAAFRGENRIATVSNAVMRLGVDAIKNIVIGAGIKRIFTSPIPAVKRYLKPLWQESAEIAATAKVLAEITGKAKPDSALIGGLLHQVGRIVVLNIAARMGGETIYDANTIQYAFDELGGEIGALMLKKWRFPEEYSIICTECDHLMRNPAEKADLCDIILVSRIHCNPKLLKHDGEKLKTADIPAYSKFEFAPPRIEGRIGELANEERQLSEAKALLLT